MAWYKTPWKLTCMVGFIYVALMLVFLSSYDFEPSATLRVDPFISENYTLPSGVVMHKNGGYDGQLYYFIALDPWLEHSTINAYRYQRLALPLLFNTLSFGNVSLIPLFFHLSLLLSFLLLTYTLSSYLVQKKRNPLVVLAIVLSPGLLVSWTFSLFEPVALLTIALALMAYEKKRYGLSGLYFTLGLFVRETNAIVIFFVLLAVVLSKYKMWEKLKILCQYAASGIWFFVFQGWLYTKFHSIPLFVSGGANLRFPLYGIFVGLSRTWSHNVMVGSQLGLGFLHTLAVSLSPYLIIPQFLLVGWYWYKHHRWQKDALSLLMISHVLIGFMLYETIWQVSLPSVVRTMFVLPLVFFMGAKKENKLYWTVFWYTLFLTFVIFVGQFVFPIPDPWYLT